MTIRDVPINTPMPIFEISRSCDWDIENESGREPARKELSSVSVRTNV